MLISNEVPGMCDAGYCVIELNGSIRTHVHLSFAFLMDTMPWIMSKTSGKRSAHSLNSPEDEVGDLFRLGWIHVEVFANLEINVAVVAYHRDDVGSVNFGLSIGVAADAVDLLDEVHVLLLRVRSFTLECWFNQNTLTPCGRSCSGMKWKSGLTSRMVEHSL